MNKCVSFDTCIVCKKDVKQILDIPGHPILMKCEECSFIQPKVFTKYDYSSNRESTSDKRSDLLLAITQKAQDAVEIKMGARVLDIGCADGKLLGWYIKGITTIGVDPAVNLVKEGLVRHHIDIAITDVFSADNIVSMFKSLKVTNPDFDIITAIDVLHLVENPLQFLLDVKKLLAPKGVVIVQVPYFADTIVTKKLPNIKPEYSGYYLTNPLQHLINLSGLEFQGMELQPEGTIRAYITHTQKTNDMFYLARDYVRRSFLWTNSQMKIMEEFRLGFYGHELYKAFECSVKEVSQARA